MKDINIERFLTDLNPNQKEAVMFGNGPLIIVAGAGSGKTKTIAARVAYHIAKGVDPQRILLLTFTRRASEEMKKRADSIISQIGMNTSSIWGGTFHSIANRILRIYSEQVGLPQEFTIMDQTDAEDLMDIIRTDLNLDKTGERFPKKSTCLSIYSRKINSEDTLESVLKNHFPWCINFQDQLSQLFKEYIEKKQNQNVLDYDDLLLYWYLLLDNEEIQESLESRFDLILVDEYQDTNTIQSGILRKMRKRNKNITVVGDDAQSIYSFRSATIRNMLDFPKHFPRAKVITLEENYRSTQPILATSNALISQAVERYSKNLFSKRVGGTKPDLVTCFDDTFQDKAVIERVLQRLEEGIKLRNQAILFRSGSHSASLEIALTRNNIPFIKYGGLRFLESSHIKDLISLLRIVDNPKDEIAWFRVLQLLKGVGPQTAANIIEHLKNNMFSPSALADFKASEDFKISLLSLKSYIEDLKNENVKPSEVIDRALLFYLPLLNENYDNPDQRSADVHQLSGLAAGYTSIASFLSDLVLDPPMFTGDLAGVPLLDEDYLILSTIHSAKGLEWDAVYLIYASDGWIPSDMSTGSAIEIEEELRLAYVAMTRAKKYLTVLWPKRNYTKPMSHSDNHIYGQLSRFLTADVLSTMIQVSYGQVEGNKEKGIKLKPIEGIKNKLKDMF